MVEAKWTGVLSTTEPRNDIGVLNVRQGNVNSEILEFQIVQNNKPYDLTGTKVYFCTNFGLSAVEKSAVIKDAINGIIIFTFNDESMQEVGRQLAYFQITKENVLIDSTQDFEYRIQASILSRLMEGGSYIERFSNILKTLGENAAYALANEIEKTNYQVSQKVAQINYLADKALLNGRIDGLTDGFKETLPTYAALVAKYPAGTTGNFIVKEDANWYFWLAGSGWTAGGAFPAATIANETISRRKLTQKSVGIDQTDFINKGTNLFEKSKVTYGSYITSVSGKLKYIESATFNSILIRVNPATQIFIDSTDFYHYFFDVNDNEIIFGGHASNTLNDLVVTTPNVDSYIAINIKNTNPRFENFVICKGSTKPKDLVPSTLDSGISVLPSQIMDGANRQLFNKDTVVEGQYDFKSTSFEGKPGEKIIHGIPFTTGAPGVKPFVFYNSKNQIVQNIEYGTGVQIPKVVTFPDTATRLVIQIFKSFAGFTFSKADLDKVMVFKGEKMPSLYVPFGQDMNSYLFNQTFYDAVEKQIILKNTPIIFTVKKDGSGDFTQFYAALKYAKNLKLANPDKKIKIYLYPGTYNLSDEIPENEWKAITCYGYATIKGVDVEAIGDFGSVIIKADLPEGTDAAHVSRISTLHVTEGEFNWKNILFIGGNVRYAGHDDDARTEGDFYIERCKFLKLKNKGTYPNAFAGGWYNKKGDKFFVDCEFETEWDGMTKDHAAFSYHSRTDTTVPHLVELENCSTTIGGQGSGVRFGGMKGPKGINSTLKIIGSNIKRVFIFEEGYTPNGVDLDISGYANTSDLEICVKVTEGQRKPEINITGPVKMTDYNTNWTN